MLQGTVLRVRRPASVANISSSVDGITGRHGRYRTLSLATTAKTPKTSLWIPVDAASTGRLWDGTAKERFHGVSSSLCVELALLLSSSWCRTWMNPSRRPSRRRRRLTADDLRRSWLPPTTRLLRLRPAHRYLVCTSTTTHFADQTALQSGGTSNFAFPLQKTVSGAQGPLLWREILWKVRC